MTTFCRQANEPTLARLRRILAKPMRDETLCCTDLYCKVAVLPLWYVWSLIGQQLWAVGPGEPQRRVCESVARVIQLDPKRGWTLPVKESMWAPAHLQRTVYAPNKELWTWLKRRLHCRQNREALNLTMNKDLLMPRPVRE